MGNHFESDETNNKMSNHVNIDKFIKQTTLSLSQTNNIRSPGFHKPSTPIFPVAIDSLRSFRFPQTFKDTLSAFKTEELNEIIDNVEDEVGSQYEDTEEKAESVEHKPKPPPPPPLKKIRIPSSPNLLFVPSQNIVPNINTFFKYIKQLGSGASCRVLKARNIQNNQLYAVKELVGKIGVNTRLFSEEVKLLKKLHHPHIVHYYDCFVDDECYYIATKYCSGGTMLDKIIKMKNFSEHQASEYIKVILNAVNYMHSLNIVHRDLKMQNMVFDELGSNGVLQLIDFGDSKVIRDKAVYESFVGTIHYVLLLYIPFSDLHIEQFAYPGSSRNTSTAYGGRIEKI